MVACGFFIARKTTMTTQQKHDDRKGRPDLWALAARLKGTPMGGWDGVTKREDHTRTIAVEPEEKPEPKLCKCGCGKPVKAGSEFHAKLHQANYEADQLQTIDRFNDPRSIEYRDRTRHGAELTTSNWAQQYPSLDEFVKGAQYYTPKDKRTRRLKK